VPITGQIDSLWPGDDGELQQGVQWQPEDRFTVNGNGTVKDNLTGLIWLKNAECFGEVNWWAALDISNGLETGHCGLTDGSSAGDWRLPNIRELHSLIDFGNIAPALPTNHPFVDVPTMGYYWSSTTYKDSEGAWWGYPGNGSVGAYQKTNNNYVWPVRSDKAVNVAPVAENDFYSTEEETSLIVVSPGVLANDTDPNGDSLTALLEDDAANGTVTLNADGSFSYTPDPEFNGVDLFTYHANDGIADSNLAIVIIMVSD
jgi:hypothetical protein